ncbi:MAG TPA: carboxypeptidase-like regulatory domain-containing protein, partial [Bacteroidales bacterium]|nr:carboxypeptidase-like regulatory domain-containing protein [Bacteroidales bacterium]
MKNKTQVKQMYSVAALLLWLVLSASAAMAQIPVTGTVTSKTDNTPMPGVNVVVKGTTIGTTTNVDGVFTLNVSDANATLVFSFIGFKTLEVPLEGRKTISVSLEEEAKELEEIVVIGYGSRAKKDVTTAISSISSEDIRQLNAVTP